MIYFHTQKKKKKKERGERERERKRDVRSTESNHEASWKRSDSFHMEIVSRLL